MKMKSALLLMGIPFLSQSIFCQCDFIVFSSDKIGLYAYTRNIDSIKYFSDDYEKPSIFSPSSREFSPHINCLHTSKLEIRIRDKYGNYIATFIWKSILPGAYKFDWWIYIRNLAFGVYYIEKIVDNDSEVHQINYF